MGCGEVHRRVTNHPCSISRYIGSLYQSCQPRRIRLEAPTAVAAHDIREGFGSAQALEYPPGIDFLFVGEDRKYAAGLDQRIERIGNLRVEARIVEQVACIPVLESRENASLVIRPGRYGTKRSSDQRGGAITDKRHNGGNRERGLGDRCQGMVDSLRQIESRVD